MRNKIDQLKREICFLIIHLFHHQSFDLMFYVQDKQSDEVMSGMVSYLTTLFDPWQASKRLPGEGYVNLVFHQ